LTTHIEVRDMAFMVNGKMRVRTQPYVIPHSDNMPKPMVEALTKSHSQVIKLKSQIAVSKALGSFASMREMVKTERDMVKAGIPPIKTTHGTVVPTTAQGKILITQQKILSGAQKQTTIVGSGYLEKTARTEVLTEKVHGLFDEIAGLKKELREKEQPIIKKSIFGDFDLGLPDLSDLKTPLIIGAVALSGLFLAGKFMGRKA